jgi:hypothetical protein
MNHISCTSKLIRLNKISKLFKGNAAVAVSGQDTASIGHVPYYNYLARSHKFFSLCPRTRAVTETNYHRRDEYEG